MNLNKKEFFLYVFIILFVFFLIIMFFDSQKYMNNNPEYFYNQGIRHYANNEKLKAIDFFHKSIEIDQTYSESYKKLGELYFEQYKYDLAIKHYTQYLIYFPKDTDALLEISQSYYELNLLEKSKHSFEKLLKIDSLSFEAYNGLGYVYLKQSKYNNSKSMFSMSIKLNDKYNPKGFKGLGLSHYFNDDVIE